MIYTGSYIGRTNVAAKEMARRLEANMLRNSSKYSIHISSANFSLIAFLVFAECAVAQPPAGSGGLNSEAQSREAVAILEERGFSGSAIVTLTFMFYLSESGEKGWKLQKEFERKYRSKPGLMLNMKFEPDTGRQITVTDMVTYASGASSCLAEAEPWRDCELNYHPVDGCRLEGGPLKICKNLSQQLSRITGIGSRPYPDYITETEYSAITDLGLDLEMCWDYPKGPGLILPSEAETQSQIELANATPIGLSPKAAGQSASSRPLCATAYSYSN